MRPIRLTMQAFGPFAGREGVDFREAMASGLFGIYGQTGAGKSTIFSAVTFALFGEATKADQDTASLRSDHADPSVMTEVEFIFEVGQRRFVVRRHPEQMRPKLRGAGETKMAHEAFLFDATGLSLEEIDEGNFGKVLAEKKLGAVRDAVIGILGYGPEQFRQIVLLPQGKFEMFLAAKTDSRLGILRELFDVSLYRRLAASFKERATKAEQEVKQEREVCVRRLRAEKFESSDALSEGIATTEGEQRRALEAEKRAYETVDGARAKYDAAGKVDGLFQAADAATLALTGLLGQEEEFRVLGERVGNARRAQGLADVEQHASEARDNAVEFEKKMQATSQFAASASNAARVAMGALEGHKARAHEIDGLRQTSEGLVRYQAALADTTGLEQALKEKVALLKGAKTAFETADRRHADLVTTKAAQEQAPKQAREKAASRGGLNVELAKVGSTLKEAEQFERTQTNLERLRAATARMESAWKTKADLAERAKARFDEAEANLAAAQALHLAAKLVPGESCPVCGSLDHPAPATGKIENQGRDQAFREARQELEGARSERDKAAEEFAAARGACEETEKEFVGLARPAQSSIDLREQAKTVKARIVGLGPEVDVAAAERLVEETGSAIVTAERVKETARGEFDRLGQDEAVARGLYENALSAIPEEYRDQSVLQSALDATRAEILARQAALKAAEDGEREARDKAIGAEKGAEAAQTAYSESLGRRGQAQAVFERRLEEADMTEESYRSFKLYVPTMDADAKGLEEYKRSVEIARKVEMDARAVIADLERPDLAPFVEALQTLEGAARTATDQRAAVDTKLAHLRGLRDAIAESLRNVEELEKRTAPLRELAKLFNADNAIKLDLETYAIGAMFDYVLVAANLRLGPMTNGRYALERETEPGGGRSRSGLGIRVFDVHTGKGRSPSTLSGGETFIAALALALGLSDVVESVNGKVHLDTIFIDEGFGSLDTENDSGTLDQVLQVLTNLVSQKRAVGLISHVRLVQEAIPNGFYVRKELQGSRIEVRAAAA